MELADCENNLIDLRNERVQLESRKRRVVELYKDGTLDRPAFGRDIQYIENRLRTTAPADNSAVELTIADFERFGQNWDLATPEEKHQMLRCMLDHLYVEFRTGQIVEVVPKLGFRSVLEATGRTKPPSDPPDGSSLVYGDPDRVRARSSGGVAGERCPRRAPPTSGSD